MFRPHRSLLLPLLLLCSGAHAQVNAFARVLGASGTTLQIGASDESAVFFEPGMPVLIMQMQADVIGARTSDNASFGDLTTLGPVGVFQRRTVASVHRSGEQLDQVVLDAAPGAAFTFGPNASVQLISFQDLGHGGDHTTSGPYAALPWNGEYGGVVAINVSGTFTLTHTISADGAGFRGGARSSEEDYHWMACDPNRFIYDGTVHFSAWKGEGFHRNTEFAWSRGRGHILNGGGGGNPHNAGGGGGGGYMPGGAGGRGFECTPEPAGGLVA